MDLKVKTILLYCKYEKNFVDTIEDYLYLHYCFVVCQLRNDQETVGG